MSEPTLFKAASRLLRCPHCAGESFHHLRVNLDVPASGPLDFLFGDLPSGAIMVICARCGLGQPFFPRLATDRLHRIDPEDAPLVERPEQCHLCSVEIPVDVNACPTCHWTWLS